MLRLVIVFLLIDDIGASGERTSHNEGQQLADFSPEATYESLQFQYMANSGSIDHLYLEEPIVFDESPQFETIAVDKSQAGNKDAILDQARAKPDLIPQDSFENADKEYNEVEHPDTCISNDCALDATLDSRFLTNSNSSPQDNKDSNQNSRFPSNTFLVPIFSELTEGSGDMHKQLPDRNDTDLESQRIISLEIEGITERYKSLVIPPSKENQPENSLTTFHTLNPWPALGFATPTKSNIGFQEPKSPVDELLVDSRRENYNKTIPERTSTRTRIASNDHWPNKPVMVPELNIDQSSNDSQIVCNPGYIHENNSCWSICEVIPDYCFNGGKCGVIENIGVFCRCSEKEHTWYKGQRCQSVLTEIQITCILIGACLITLLLFLTLMVAFVVKLRSLKNKQQTFDSRSKLWISSTPHINSSFLSEICQQGDCSPLASHAPNSQSTLLGENHLTQGSFKSQQDVQKEALTRSPDEDMALNIQNTGISKCNENAETDHDLCVLWRTERTAV
ncbi:uncharacterized protein LOC122539684 isoform X1 [Chiloscyllium plagiosum]|uniref:uncharacterized protein LOC122539684 isoform X1 n=2 Tax=Chiloscyllium plagiosum TaxID=36176 RepID=UPI001CB87C75|nr:uncharacterized protein LOC122539684 isoform X1 [Chiloscyllium plagiosum]